MPQLRTVTVLPEASGAADPPPHWRQPRQSRGSRPKPSPLLWQGGYRVGAMGRAAAEPVGSGFDASADAEA